MWMMDQYCFSSLGASIGSLGTHTLFLFTGSLFTTLGSPLRCYWEALLSYFLVKQRLMFSFGVFFEIKIVSMANKTICISADEYPQFIQYRESINSFASSHVATIAKSGKSTKCLLSPSCKQIINSRAIDHMTGNPDLFSTFQPYTSISHVTLANGSISRVLCSGTINPIPSLSLSLVLGLPNFSLNLLSVSKLTHASSHSFLTIACFKTIQQYV